MMFPSGFINRSLHNPDLLYNGFTVARNMLQRLHRPATVTRMPYRRSRAGKQVRERLLRSKNLISVVNVANSSSRRNSHRLSIRVASCALKPRCLIYPVVIDDSTESMSDYGSEISVDNCSLALFDQDNNSSNEMAIEGTNLHTTSAMSLNFQFQFSIFNFSQFRTPLRN